MKITIDSIKKTALLTGGLFLSVLSVNADDVQKSIDFNYLRTPEASAFKKYGEESVNEYTGTADISVPLYTIKCKDIEIPLVLRYDASGIKVEQEASWVGLGWNLMVGGCINYVCAGGHDMYQTQYVDNKVWTEYLTSEFGSWYVDDSIKKYVAHPGITSQTLEQIDSWASRSRNLYYTYNPKDKFNWMATRPLSYQRFVESYVDVTFYDGMKDYIDYGYGERDFYSVNVMGKSFMFFIDPFTLKVFNIGKAGEDFVVNPKYESSPKTGIGNQPDICGWTIKDSDGYIYSFTVGDKYQRDKNWSQPYTSCWYLTKIQSPVGETVEFEYDSITKSGREILAESVKLPFIHDLGAFCCGDAADQLRTAYVNPIQSENYGMSTTSHYLTKITTSNQTVTFSTSGSSLNSGKKLNSIKVKSYDGATIKTINFSYGSFAPSNVGGNYASKDNSITSQYRLKLNNVKEIASGETLTTSFSYNEKVNLPSKRSYAQDYWGYYNGKENKVGNKYTMIPTPQRFMSSWYDERINEYKGIGGANRNSDSIYMQAAILNKIVYPTGGYTKYEYGPNRCVVSRSESDRPFDIDIKKYFSYTPDVPAGANPVSNAPYNFTLKEELDFTLSVKCNGDAMDGKSFSVVIVSMSSGKTTPVTVTYKSSTEFKVVLQDKLPAGSYQLIIGAPSTGTKNYGISCNLTGYYKSSQTQKTYTKAVGGLRVKRISNYDSDDKLINYTEYDYSGGILLNRIETIDYMRMFNGRPKPSNYTIANISHYIDVYTITAGHPHMPTFFASCNPGIVGYSKVTKNKFNANGILEKSVVTSYKNNGPINMYGVDHYTSLDNGVIMSQEIRNASGAIVATTINNYVVDNEDHYMTNIVAKQKYVSFSSGSSIPYYEFQERHDKTGAVVSREKVTLYAEPGSYDILRYPFILSRSELEKTITTEYSPNGEILFTTKKYSYNDKNHQVAQIDEYRSKNEKDARNGISLTNQFNRTKIKYIVDDSKYKSIVDNHHRLNGVVETQNILVDNGKENRVSTQRTDYKNGTYCFSLPQSSSTSVGNAPLETRATYTYDGDCNVRSVTIDGKETVYIWSYKSQYPIAKIEGLTFEKIINSIGQIEDSQYPEEMPTTERGQTEISKIMRETDTSKINTFITTIRKKVNELGGYITTYTYKPLVGITSETKPNGMKTTYRYDGFGRLTKVLDNNGSVISTNSYNYKK